MFQDLKASTSLSVSKSGQAFSSGVAILNMNLTEFASGLGWTAWHLRSTFESGRLAVQPACVADVGSLLNPKP